MITRGIHDQVERWREHMSSQYFRYGKDGKVVQLSMRPVQFWEMVFPKQGLPTILKTIKWNGEHRKDLKIHTEIMRHALKLKKLPKLNLDKVQPFIVPGDFVACVPIGIKEDNIWPKIDKATGKPNAFAGQEQL